MLHDILKNQMDLLIFLTMILAALIYVDIRFLRRVHSSLLRVRTWTSAILLASIGGLAAHQAGEYHRDRMRLSVEGFAPTYALEMMHNGHGRLKSQDIENDPVYLTLIERQKRWLEANPAVADVYTLRMSEDGQVVYVVNSESDFDRDGVYESERERRVPPGARHPQTTSLMLRAFGGETVFDDVPDSNHRGASISAYTPLLDVDGRIDGILAVDFAADDWVRTILLTRIGLMGLSMAVILGLIVQTCDSIILQAEVQSHQDVAEKCRTQTAVAEEALRRLQSYEFAMDSHAILLVTDESGKIMHANELFCALCGFRREELVGQSYQMIASGHHSRTFWESMRRSISQGQVWKGEICNRARDGAVFWIDSTVVPFRDSSKTGTTFISIGTDITERKHYEYELMTAARLDKLTGLPNRSLLLDRLQQSIERSKRIPGHGFAVMFMDFDRFKLINDSLGHDVGDMLLKEIAARLKDHLRGCDSISLDAGGTTVARLGGDEFVVLVEGVQRPADATAVAERLLKACDEPYHVGEHVIRSTASIGIVCSAESYCSADEMLRDADTAMYQAKARGKARYVIFDASMQQAVRERLQIENDLRASLRSGEFFLMYQPIISLEDGSLCGVEALARWRHPVHGVIAPDRFIGIAEEIHLIMPLTMWFLEQACRQFSEWHSDHPQTAPDCVSVNLSGVQLSEPELVEQITRVIGNAGIAPDQLQLEITEAEIMQDREAAVGVLNALKAAGIRLAMDDFGTGQSSLACLHEFPFDVLKIDRAFISNLQQGRAFVLLTNSIVSLAENLGMICVAEGIESLEQIATLQAMGCSCGQGYYLGRPVSAEDFINGDWQYLDSREPANDSEVLV